MQHITVHYSTLQYITIHYSTLQHITVHYITLVCFALLCAALLCFALLFVPGEPTLKGSGEPEIRGCLGGNLAQSGQITHGPLIPIANSSKDAYRQSLIGEKSSHLTQNCSHTSLGSVVKHGFCCPHILLPQLWMCEPGQRCASARWM